MSSARGGNRDPPISEYEKQRLENMAKNKERLDSLCLPKTNTRVQPAQTNKRTKRTHNTSDASIEPHNLRPRPQRIIDETTNEQIINDLGYEVVGEFLSDNQDLHSGEQKRNGRGITTMMEIFSRKPDMPKIKIELNEFGQPVGESGRKFSSVIGCHVRNKLPVRFNDWRDVHIKKKLEVWDDLQTFYDVDEAAKKWFMDTAARKWKDYKAVLKEKYFDETLTDEQMKERVNNKLNDADWNHLIQFWRSPECEARTARGKANRAKLKVHHTSGSVSHAYCRHNLGKKLGRPPRRDELYINTHTRKNGVPLREAAATIDKLIAIAEDRPELKDRTIQQGDVYSAVCGVKEPRGRVRVLGLGPTPQEIGIPGVKGLSTRLQMEIFARQQAEKRVAVLEEERREQGRANLEVLSQNGSNSRHYGIPTPKEHIDEAYNVHGCEQYDNYVDNEDYDQYGEEDDNLVSHRLDATRSAMNITTATNDVRPCFANDTYVQMEERLLHPRPVVPQSTMNMTTIPTNDIHPRPVGNDVATKESLLPPRRVAAPSAIDMTTTPANDVLPRFENDTHLPAREESLMPPKRVAAQSAIKMTTTNDILPCFANDIHAGTDESLLPHRHDAAHSAINKTTTAKNDGPPSFAHDKLVGNDVLLFAMLRSDSAVAKGTIISTNPNTMVGGEPLGKQFCEVVVNVVMKRDALLPRAYGEMQTMASAHMMAIAWPYNKMKVCNKKVSGPLKGAVGSVGRRLASVSGR